MHIVAGKRLWAGGLAAAICGLALLASSGANATVVIDQSNLVDVTKGALVVSAVAPPGGSFGGVEQVQTITAGLDGRLARIDVQVSRLRDLDLPEVTAFVYDGDYAMAQGVAGGTPGGFAPLVGSVASSDLPTFAQSQAGELLSFDAEGLNFHVHAGQVFSVLLAVTQGDVFLVRWAYGYQDPNDPSGAIGLAYTGGYNSRKEGTGNFIESFYDRGFRTAVDVTPVPEPEIWAMMLAGFLSIGVALRHRGCDEALPAS